MRRKTKRLLAAGMALAVLATNLTPLSLAGGGADYAAVDAVAEQSAAVDAVAAHEHNYTVTKSGFKVQFKSTGLAEPYADLTCTNTTGYCIHKTPRVTGAFAQPSSTTEETCVSNRIYHYAATTVTYWGKKYNVAAGDVEVADTKDSTKHTYVATWTPGSADASGTGTMYLTVSCSGCKKTFATNLLVTANSNTATDATCTANQKYTYNKGDFQEVVEGKAFSNPNPVTLEVPDSKLKHTPGNTTVSWPTAPTGSNGDYTAAVSVNVTCASCNASTVISNVLAKCQGTIPATCTTKAEAMFNLNENLTLDESGWAGTVHVSDTKTYSVGEEPDHTYQVAWNWADSTDGSVPTAAAALTCDLCDLNATADVSIAKGAYTAPTCSAAGSQEYIATATYNGKQVGTDKHTVSIPATGEHAYTVGGWTLFDSPTGTGNFYKGTARIYCRNTGCSYYLTPYQTVEVTPTISESISPTCTQKGSKTYLFTAKLRGDPAIENNPYTKVVEIPATGHTYGEPVMDWDFSGTNPTATATFTCINANCGHKEVVTFESSQIGHVHQTSCTEEDHDLYTATFIFQGKNYEKTYTVAHPGTHPRPRLHRQMDLGRGPGRRCDPDPDLQQV